VVTAVAVCVLLVGGPVPAGTAVTMPSPGGSVTFAVTRDLPRRAMNDEVFRNAKGWLVFKGNVDPGWNNRFVQIYKRLCKACQWAIVKRTRTDGSGRWRTRISAPRTGYWYWKGLVPRAGGYGKSVTRTYRAYVG
jgi:hypothetical protein